jgi:hypothetical protein
MRLREIAKFHCRKYLGLNRTRFLKNIEVFLQKHKVWYSNLAPQVVLNRHDGAFATLSPLYGSFCNLVSLTSMDLNCIVTYINRKYLALIRTRFWKNIEGIFARKFLALIRTLFLQNIEGNFARKYLALNRTRNGKRTTPGIPTWSPTVVLTRPDGA